jgi:hypothetical protein
MWAPGCTHKLQLPVVALDVVATTSMGTSLQRVPAKGRHELSIRVSLSGNAHMGGLMIGLLTCEFCPLR